MAREAIHLMLLLASMALFHRTVSAFEVDGASMAPTIYPHEYVIVDRIATMLRLPQRGEVIVFRYPGNPRIDYVKRVVGLPGETIAIGRGRVWVNGRSLNEPYVRERPRYLWGPAVVPPDSIFVLGDNRNSSSDSHLWGAVPLQNIVGRAWFAYRPFSRLTWLAGRAPELEPAQ
ncbi:MAG: signal peptidase I [Chloroflexi bacterium]|nr:signal peptidase I [Chloroflexota bacterium]